MPTGTPILFRPVPRCSDVPLPGFATGPAKLAAARARRGLQQARGGPPCCAGRSRNCLQRRAGMHSSVGFHTVALAPPAPAAWVPAALPPTPHPEQRLDSPPAWAGVHFDQLKHGADLDSAPDRGGKKYEHQAHGKPRPLPRAENLLCNRFGYVAWLRLLRFWLWP